MTPTEITAAVKQRKKITVIDGFQSFLSNVFGSKLEKLPFAHEVVRLSEYCYKDLYYIGNRNRMPQVLLVSSSPPPMAAKMSANVVDLKRERYEAKIM